MPLLTPEEFQEKHNRRLKAASEDMVKGIDRVTENPMAKAAAKQDKMIARLTESVRNGKWKRGLLGVSLEAWRSKAKDVGIPRVAAGIDAAAGKVKDFAAKLLPHVAAGQALVSKLPDMTLADSANRVVTYMNHMAKFKK